MRRLLLVSCLVFWPSYISAQEVPAQARIASLSLFKNGLAIVKQEVDVPGAGEFRIQAYFEPIHGTYWTEGDVQATTYVRPCEVEQTDVPHNDANLQEELEGKKVTLKFKGDKAEVVSGTVISLAKAPTRSLGFPGVRGETTGGGRFLILKTDRGYSYVDPSDIRSIDVTGFGEKVKKRVPCLVLHVDGKDAKAGKVVIRYLTKGLSWASNYHIDLTDPKQLLVRQGAVLRNEWLTFKDAEVFLITGNSSVKYANVLSPLAANATWSMFMSQILNPAGMHYGAAISNSMLTNQITTNFETRTALGLDPNAFASGEGVDLHYQPIGKRSLNLGETMSLTVAQAKAAYEKVVEWEIGASYSLHGSTSPSVTELWDAIRFKNPFSFPMTGSPAVVMDKERFLGQHFSHFASPGEDEFLRINKALSLRTHHVEVTEPEQNAVTVAGHPYTKISVVADLAVYNHRKEDVKMVIRRQYWGELVSAEGQPRQLKRQDPGGWHQDHFVNHYGELVWNLTLTAGQERKLQYRYTVLVRRR